MASHFLSILILLLFSIFFLFIDATTYKASGIIYCHPNEPMKGVRVELYEEDPLKDDFLDIYTTAENGTFKVGGDESEILNEQPYLWITHKCGNGPLKEGCFYTSRLRFEGDFDENEYNFNVKVNLLGDNADVNGKTYKLERKQGCQ